MTWDPEEPSTITALHTIPPLPRWTIYRIWCDRSFTECSEWDLAWEMAGYYREQGRSAVIYKYTHIKNLTVTAHFALDSSK